MTKKQRLEAMEEFHAQSLAEYGFYIHAVFYPESDDYANVHTHGIVSSLGHKDLQITLPIDPGISGRIFHIMVEGIRKGLSFKDGQRYSEVIYDFEILCKEFQEGDRKVIRVILPDAKGVYPGDPGCDPMYEFQLIDQYTVPELKLVRESLSQLN